MTDWSLEVAVTKQIKAASSVKKIVLYSQQLASISTYQFRLVISSVPIQVGSGYASDCEIVECRPSSTISNGLIKNETSIIGTV